MNRSSLPQLLVAVAALVLSSACAGPNKGPKPVVSMLGQTLESPGLPEGKRDVMKLEAQAAMGSWEFEATEMNAIWVGRRLAYLGQYREAIGWYRGALTGFQDSYRLRRHLGHRLLTVREIDDAITVLTRAQELAENQPNRVEPDGAPGRSGEPRSTTHGNIDYHLALAYYCKGKFNRAAELWLECARTWSRNDDARVAAVHWAYTSLVRAGRDDEAKRALDLVDEEPDVIENFAYGDLLELYRGKTSIDAALEREDRSAAFDYGLARHMIATGDRERGEALLRDLVARPGWPAFGVLAAEADVAAMADEPPAADA
ncbi:MAG: hypothetical protein AAF957_07195 [Planctomycetota bacterium]